MTIYFYSKIYEKTMIESKIKNEELVLVAYEMISYLNE